MRLVTKLVDLKVHRGGPCRDADVVSLLQDGTKRKGFGTGRGAGGFSARRIVETTMPLQIISL